MRQAIRVRLVLAIFYLAASACQSEVTPETGEAPAAVVASVTPVVMQTLRPDTPVTSQPTTASIPALATVPVLTPAISPTDTALVAPAHRIGVRVVDGESQFYDRQTGEVFVPRGFNYVRVAPMGGYGGMWHATLNPGYYDPQRAEGALRQMQEYGYNVVRVFID